MLMTIRQQRWAGENLPEIIWAGWLIALFGGFLLLNFWLPFNLLAYAVVAFFGWLVPVFYPRAGLYALTFLLLIFAKFFTLQSLVVNQQEYKFYLVDILFAAILLGLLARWLKGRLKFSWQWPDVLLAVFLIMVAVYFFLSIGRRDGDFALSFSSLKNYAFYPLFYFASYALIENKRILKIWLSFALSGAVGIIGFIIYGLITGQGLWTEITPLSTAGSRLLDFDHAFYLGLVVLFLLAYVIFKPGPSARRLLALVPVFLIGIAGSLMRHLWLALAAAVIGVYALLPRPARLNFRRMIWQYLSIFGVLALLAIFAINLWPFSGLARLTGEVNEQITGRAISLFKPDDTSIAWRGAVWQSVWGKYQVNFLSGLGFGQKIFVDMGNYRDYVEVRNIHNSFLAVFVQLGLVGFLILASFMVGQFAKLISLTASRPDSAMMKYAVLGVMIFCGTAFLFQPYLEANFFNIPFWLSLGLAKRTYEGAFG